VLATEALAIAVRQNVDIKGIIVDVQETKLLQYAPDMAAVLSDITSAKVLFNLLASFRISCGLSIYLSKTEVMWIGSPRSNNTKPLGINFKLFRDFRQYKNKQKKNKTKQNKKAFECLAFSRLIFVW